MILVVKRHVSQDGKIVLALCDKDILGKIISEGQKQLDLTSNFYNGETKEEQEIIKDIKSVYIINAIGKIAIEFLIRLNLLNKESIKHISNTPYAQVIISKD